MENHTEIKCPGCGENDLVKHGRSGNGMQRYRCKICKKTFQLDYSYNAWRPGVKEQIETQIRNNSGVRGASRNLGIAKGTVISALKKKRREK